MPVYRPALVSSLSELVMTGTTVRVLENRQALQVLGGDGCQLGVGRVGSGVVEEDADLGLPALEVRPQDLRDVDVVDREFPSDVAFPPLAGHKGEAAAVGADIADPLACAREARLDSRGPSMVSRFTGVRRGWSLWPPFASSTREPSTLTPIRVSPATVRLKTLRVN